MTTTVTTAYCLHCAKFRYVKANGYCVPCSDNLGIADVVKHPRSVTHKKPAKPKDPNQPKARRVKADKIKDEQELSAILPMLRSGDSWYEEAALILSKVIKKEELGDDGQVIKPAVVDVWTKSRVMFTYRRLKLQGIKKMSTEELLFSLLTTSPQTIGQIAGKTFLDYPWAYQVLSRMAKKDKRIKTARSDHKNQLMFYI